MTTPFALPPLPIPDPLRLHFQQLKTNLNLTPSFQNIISTRHAAVRSAFENLNPGIENTKVIGSVGRRTRIQPRPGEKFDIDIVVVLGDFTGWGTEGITSAAAIDNLYRTACSSDRYSAFEPTADAPTVTLFFGNEIHVELVPAYVDNVGRSHGGRPTPPIGRGYWVPGPNGWIHADYDFDAGVITQLNELSDQRLVPAIKMLKAVKRAHLPDFKSFALEILAARTIPMIIAGYKSVRQRAPTDSEMLLDFFLMAPGLLSEGLAMQGSNSPPILLTVPEQARAQRLFQAAVAYIQQIEHASSLATRVAGWRELFGDVFPASK